MVCGAPHGDVSLRARYTIALFRETVADSSIRIPTSGGHCGQKKAPTPGRLHAM
jgi:hypothetical protein